MSHRKTIVGLCLLVCLALGAFAAPGASAATKGTTAFTCEHKAEATYIYSDVHCKDLSAGEKTGEYERREITAGLTTEVLAPNAEDIELKVTDGGVVVKLRTTEAQATGWTENILEGAEHFIYGEGRVHYTNVAANHGCTVYADESEGGDNEAKGTITTKQLVATTTGQGDFLKISPKSGTVLATFYLTGCEKGFEFLNRTWEVTGSLKVVPNGATAEIDHPEVTTQDTFKVDGVAAGLLSSMTVSGRVKEGKEAYVPLAAFPITTFSPRPPVQIPGKPRRASRSKAPSAGALFGGLL